MAMTMVVVTMEVMTMIIVMVVVIMTMGSDGIKTPRQRRVIAPSRNTLVVTTMVITEVQVLDKVQCTCNGADYENVMMALMTTAMVNILPACTYSTRLGFK